MSEPKQINPPLRVAHIISGDLWAGAEVMAVNLLRTFALGKDFALLAVVLNKGRVSQALADSGINTAIVDERVHSFPKIVYELGKILRAFRPQIVHAHRYKENLAGFLAARRLKPRPALVSTQHGLPEGYGNNQPLKSRILTALNFFLLSRCFHKTVAVSTEMKTALVSECGFRAGKLAVIHNGISLPEEAQKPERKEFVIGSCGRLTPVKNYDLLMDIAALVRKEQNNISFVLAGDGPEKTHLENLRTRYNLDGSFSMPGHLVDMSSFYREIDVFINTSWHEGIPMSVLEAMANGIPVIAPDVGGFAEIIDHGIDGFLILDHCPERFAAKCLELSSDREKWARMTRAAREKIEKQFSNSHMAQNYLDLYQALHLENQQKCKT